MADLCSTKGQVRGLNPLGDVSLLIKFNTIYDLNEFKI